jgi:hypothetical protein
VALKRPQHPARVAVVVVAVLIAVNVAIIGARSQNDGPATASRPTEIQQLFPEETQRILPQGTVGADLRDEFQGQLTIDGVLIPKDETTGDPSLGLVLFEPAEGKTFREFTGGNHNAHLDWWPRTISTPEDAKAQRQLRSYTWAFGVG